MNLRPRQRDEPEVSLTPLIDVVFLLLIFFMVSTTFDRESQLTVELPEASSEPVSAPDNVLEITISAEGRYFIGDQEVINTRADTLRKAIVDRLGDSRDRPVILRADGLTPHQAVVTAMDVISQLGIEHLSLATVQHTESR